MKIVFMQIGLIGQGWVGKSYADDFESRGYSVVRYSLEEPYTSNKAQIGTCDIVFIAVPTPTTAKGFDDSIVRQVIKLVGSNKIAVVKSTMVPGTTESLQEENPEIFVLHSPEFLTESRAAYEVAHPVRTIVGIPLDNDVYHTKARKVIEVLSEAPYVRIMNARDAEIVKYAGNGFLFTKVIFANILHDLVLATGGDWATVRDAFGNDPRIGSSHTEPIHKDGRGAGGNCFLKDFEAFHAMSMQYLNDPLIHALLLNLKKKNDDLLTRSGKDLELLHAVYGDSAYDTISS